MVTLLHDLSIKFRNLRTIVRARKTSLSSYNMQLLKLVGGSEKFTVRPKPGSFTELRRRLVTVWRQKSLDECHLAAGGRKRKRGNLIQGPQKND